jgi:hypothetical protein
MSDKLKFLPEAFTSTPIEMREVAIAVAEEIVEPGFDGMLHGRRNTRNRGCKGPLCQKALRDWQRNRTVERNAQRGKETRTYSRDFQYVAVDEILGVFQKSYEVTRQSWIGDMAIEIKTLLELNDIMKSWGDVEPYRHPTVRVARLYKKKQAA